MAILNGTDDDDVIEGTGGNDIIHGLRGMDGLYGRGGADQLFGDDDDDYLYGGSGNDLLEGGRGDDYLEGQGGNDRLIGGSGDNSLFGGAGNDYLDGGGSGDNRIDGGAGRDTMTGGTVYYVDNVGDRIIDDDGGRIFSSVSFDLNDTPFMDEVILTGNGNINATGNDLDNDLEGNAGKNRLDGGAGNDFIAGGGRDILIGGSGDDFLSFDVERRFDAGQLREEENGGYDLLNLYLQDDAPGGRHSITLPQNFEYISVYEFTGEVEVEIFGGGDSNSITSSAGTVYGQGGNDQLFGVYFSTFGVRLNGGAGNDVLAGGSGSEDTLIGGAGRDAFMFWQLNDDLPLEVDTINDFQDGADMIYLSSSDFALGGEGPLSASRFHAGTSAQTADHRIVFDAATGALYYDADGSGAQSQIQLAVVNHNGSITHEDFLVVSDFSALP